MAGFLPGGENAFGMLGTGNTAFRSRPTEVTHKFSLNALEKIIQVEFNWASTAVLTSDGRVFTWGNGYGGRLGNGSETHTLVPSDITSHFNLASGEVITKLFMVVIEALP